jgi:glycyl-tRNA synthetase beta chain
MSGELLLELLSEEIPARMQRRAIDDLIALVRDKLSAADIPAANVAGYVTPRRLVVAADGIPTRQPDRTEERRGPRVGAPQQAIEGFLRAAGVGSLDQCERRDTGRGEFYFAIVKQDGRPSAEVLPELLHAAMAALPWPKSMRYPASSLRWVRPLNSVVCLFDGEVLKLPLGDVPVGRVTRGHRFVAPGEITVANGADYRTKLAAAHVVLDWAERRSIIARDLARLAKAEGLTVKDDLGLLDEVSGLVEWPVVLMGKIDTDFVRPLPDGLPPEVLATAMRTHQKYFSCLNADGSPAPRFLFVANNETPDRGATIAAGNERVLRARLSDARFFWDQDRKVRLEDRVEALKQRVYHEKLGSVYDKVERMERLAEHLAETLAPQFVTPAEAGVQGTAAEPVSLDSRFRGNDEAAFKERCIRAARLAKADLSTGMVGEFPELQGIMGRYYALNDGEDARAADAIANHYKPLGPNDSVPPAPESIVVALADKIDALAGFFTVREMPTGSRDPYALRRAALGIIRLVIENHLRFSLGRVIVAARAFLDPIELRSSFDEGPVKGILLDFIAERLKVHLREQGVRHDLISAVFALSEDDLVRLLARVQALQTFIQTEDGASLLIGYRRASNIVGIEERKDGQKHDGPVDGELLQRGEPEERMLNLVLDRSTPIFRTALDAENFDGAMSTMATLRRPIDEFFDKVTVNVSDPKLRENRLRLLARIRATMNQVADFSQIEG